MGQKVHPFGIRLGYNKNWLSRWFSAKEYPAFVFEDSKIRKFVKQRNAEAGLAKIEIERAGGKVRLILSTARPGIIIGRKGVETRSSALSCARNSAANSPSRSAKSAAPKWMPSSLLKISLSSLNAALPSAAP